MYNPPNRHPSPSANSNLRATQRGIISRHGNREQSRRNAKMAKSAATDTLGHIEAKRCLRLQQALHNCLRPCMQRSRMKLIGCSYSHAPPRKHLTPLPALKPGPPWPLQISPSSSGWGSEALPPMALGSSSAALHVLFV